MKRQKKFKPEELAGFCDQIAMTLKSGIPVYEGIDMLLKEIDDQETKNILEEMIDLMEENETVYHAMEKTGAFPSYLIHMVHIGERSGKLGDVLAAMAIYYKREATMNASIGNAFAYPMMMLGMISIILVALIWKILPMFQNVFQNLDVSVADSSNHIMQVGMNIGKGVAIVTLVLIVVGFGLYAWYHTEKGTKIMRRWGCSFFVTRETARLMAIGRFLSSMSVMMKSAMNIEDAFELAKDVVENPRLTGQVEKCYEEVVDRKPLSDALRENKIVSGMQGSILGMAERSGLLEDAVTEISEQYDEQIENQLNAVCGRVETTLVISLSVIVGAVLVAIMLPLVSIISAIG